MTEKEFNLSEKVFYAVAPPNKNPFGRHCVNIEDVKEAVKRLKEVKIEVVEYPAVLEVCDICHTNEGSIGVWFIYEGKKYHFKCLLDAIFGDKLT